MMFLSEESVDLKTVCIANVCLFLALVLGHSIPPTFKMGKTGKKWFLIIFFGLLVGIAFNIVLPSSLHIVTDAWEAYQNSTKDNDTDIFFELLRRLDDDDDDDDDDSFRRIIGVAICFGFMVLFVAEFLSKQITKKQRANEVQLPLVEKPQAERDEYSRGALRNLYISFYVFAALGCMGGYLVCDSSVQRAFIFIAQGLCLFPASVLYGLKMREDQTSTSCNVADALLQSLITPVLNVVFLLIMNLFKGELYFYIISLGYPLFCGLVLFFSMMYVISMVHVEETVTSSMIAVLSMILPYFAFMLFGRD